MTWGKLALTGTLTLGSLGAGDAAVLNETPIKAEYQLSERVLVEQKENVVEATLPWKDQRGLRIKYDMGEPTVGEKMKDKRKQEVITEPINTQKEKLETKLFLAELVKEATTTPANATFDVEWFGVALPKGYPQGSFNFVATTSPSSKTIDTIISETQAELATSDAFKMDVLLHERPDTNRFCYQIEGWEDYDFFYQPALTPEEIADGASRPEEIVGSYAVYHKTLKNHRVGGTNYETGKVAHIPYPYIWSVNDESTKHRAEAFSIENGEMCVTVAWTDLVGMEYPIHIDPTFGYTSAGASTQISTSAHWGCSANPGEVGTVIELHAYWHYVSAEQTATNRLNNSTPTELVNGTTQSIASSQWGDTTGLSTAVSAETYYITSNSTNSGIRIGYDAVGSDGCGGNLLGGTWTPSTLRNVSTYATYTASGGSPAPAQDVIFFE